MPGFVGRLTKDDKDGIGLPSTGQLVMLELDERRAVHARQLRHRLGGRQSPVQVSFLAGG